MLTVSWSCVAQATMTFVIIVMAIMFPVDSPNNRAEWPIPAANFTWELPAAFTRGVLLLCAAS
jgi:hypothetical protein